MKGRSVWYSEDAFGKLLKARRLLEKINQKNVSLSYVAEQGAAMVLQEARRQLKARSKKNGKR